MQTIRLFLSIVLTIAVFQGIGQINDSGCTDPAATNYNADATFDNGTCCYLAHYVTISSEGFGYAALHNINDVTTQYVNFPGSAVFCLNAGCYSLFVNSSSADNVLCVMSIDGAEGINISSQDLGGYDYSFSVGDNVISGCTDPNSCSFNPAATCNDGTCSYECLGCTDPNAPNYNSIATVDDGSCCTNDNWYTLNASAPCYASFYSSDLGFLGGISYPEQTGVCLPVDCITMNILSYETSQPLTYTVISNTNEIVASGSFADNFYDGLTFGLNGVIAGCADANACNFNPLATCTDWYNCEYSCLGCTNPEAPNYDPQATTDDGSCCTNENWLTISASADCYVLFSSNDWIDNFNPSFYVSAFSPIHACIPDGCYTLIITGVGFIQDFNVQISDSNQQILFDGTATEGELQLSFVKNGIAGCTDSNACNYDPNSTCTDNTLCSYDCFGCTDPNADNYDSGATIDDGSCCMNLYTVQLSAPAYWSANSTVNYYAFSGYYPEVSTFCADSGCYGFYIYSSTNELIEYSITDQSGNIVLQGSTDIYGQVNVNFDINSTPGCTDPNACNFDPTANCPDNSCNYDCYGCTNPNAGNYDPNATIDNNSCCFDTWYTITFSDQAYWSVYSMNNLNVGGGSYLQNEGFCMGDECFSLNIYSLNGSTIDFSIYSPDGSVYYSGSTDSFGYAYVVFSENDTFGCMDLNACNYDPQATCSDWYACDYSCYGCTDPNAGNYNPNATIDNGQCCQNNWYTIDMSGEGYWYVENFSAGIYSNGNYPQQNGFCADASCFSIYVYSYGSVPVEFQISGPLGDTIYSGITNSSGYLIASVSTTGEIAGCTEPNSCNYNPDATCDDGSCNFYCGGCLDPAGLNYNPLAWFDDGSCIYSVQSPMMNLSVDTNEDEGVYYVRMDMVELGNGAPYLLSSDYNTDMMMIEGNGQYFTGPFPCGEDVVITVQSAELGMMEYMVSDPLAGQCAIVDNITEEELSSTSMYPNPTSGLINISGLVSGKLLVELYDTTGRVVYTSSTNQGGSNFSFNADNLSEGFYQLRIINNENSEFHQVLITR